MRTWAETPGLSAVFGCVCWLACAGGVEAQSGHGFDAAGDSASSALPSLRVGDSEAAARHDLALAVEQIRQGHDAAGQRRLESLIARHPDSSVSDAARATVAELYLRRSALRPDSQRSNLGVPTLKPEDGRWRVEVRRGALLADSFRSTVGDRVFFSAASIELGKRASDALSAQAQWLKRHPEVSVTIEGHADDPGAEGDNRMLAQRRADAVRRRLVEEGQRAGTIADAPADLVAVGVLGAVSSFSNSYRNGRFGSDITVDELAAFVRRWVANALK